MKTIPCGAKLKYFKTRIDSVQDENFLKHKKGDSTGIVIIVIMRNFIFVTSIFGENIHFH